MYVHLKQSGELLARDGELWTAQGLRYSTEKIISARRLTAHLGIKGLMLVSGAGNVVRGEKLKAHGVANGLADFMGRLGTIQNTAALAAQFRDSNVPVLPMTADNIKLEDPSIPEGWFVQYSLDRVLKAYEDGQVVLVSGGIGLDNVSTDTAVVAYAFRHKTEQPEDDVLVLKGTKHDGVFDEDPAKSTKARRFVSISAGKMIANYEQWGRVVDMAALELVQESGLSMRVYADGQHDLRTVLSDHRQTAGDHTASDIGTLIIPGEDDPIYADAA